MLSHRALRAKALARPAVKAEFDRLKPEFDFLDQALAARKSAGLTQADVARRIGTTQSAIARLESGSGKHLPSLATLHKYADAVGCRVEIRLVKGRGMAGGTAKRGLGGGKARAVRAAQPSVSKHG